MTTNVANTATVRRFIFVILSVLKVFCFALRSSERVVLRVVLCSAGAECLLAPQEQRFLAPQEQNVSLLRRSRMFLCSAGAECFFAPQEQNVSLLRRSNVSLLRRSNVSLLRRSRMFIAACALTRHSGGVRCGDHCLDHSR